MNSEGGLSSAAAAFLAWCRIEKGLAPQTLYAYSLDINGFQSFWAGRKQTGLPAAADLGAYVDELYAAGLSGRLGLIPSWKDVASYGQRLRPHFKRCRKAKQP